MLLSKSAITLFSTIGASSIPVISVVALYQIKHFSLGNNSEKSSPSTATEENVITLPPAPSQPEEPKQAEPQQKASEESQNVLPATEATTPKTEDTSKSDNTKESPAQTTVIAVKPSTPTPNEEPTTEETVVTPVINDIADLQRLTKTILENFMARQQAQIPSDADIGEDLDAFIELLTKKHSTIIKEPEKSTAQSVIDSLKALKAKISTKQ